MSWAPFRWFLLRGTGMPFPAAAASADAGSLLSERTWEARLTAAREALWRHCDDPLFREAVFLSSPEVDALLDAWRAGSSGSPRNRKARKRERTLGRYLQRFSAKNDSTSFFGAVAAGRLDGTLDPEQPLPIWSRRRVSVNQWVVQRLLERARADLLTAGEWTEWPRRAPGASVGAGGVRRLEVIGGKLVEVARRQDPFAPRVLELATGERTAGVVAARTATAAGDLAALRNEGLLAGSELLPTGLEKPLAEARARLAAQAPSPLRDAWLARLDTLAITRDAFALAPLADRRVLAAEVDALVAGATGEPPRRRAGEFYASRTALHEMCDRTVEPIGLPPGWAARLAAATRPYLDLCLLPVLVERAHFSAWLASSGAAAGPGAASWIDVHAALSADRTAYDLAAPAASAPLRAALRTLRAALRATIDAHLAQAGAGVPLALDPGALAPALEAARPLLASTGRAYANPDLMACAQPGGGLIPVLAEAHHLPVLTGCLVTPLGARDAIVADTRELLRALCAPAAPAFVCSFDHSYISVGPDFGEVALEISGLSPRPPERRASFGDLRVIREGDRCRFVVPSHAGPEVEVAPLTRLAALHRASPVFAVPAVDFAEWLAEPGWLAPHELPRLSWGELVVHRRTWAPEAPAWVDADHPWRALEALRSACPGLPRHVFLRSAGEPKPIAIDLEDPLAVELAIHVAAPERAVTFTEMLPGPGDLWLRSQSGVHTCELRTVFTWGGSIPSRSGT